MEVEAAEGGAATSVTEARLHERMQEQAAAEWNESRDAALLERDELERQVEALQPPAEDVAEKERLLSEGFLDWAKKGERPRGSHSRARTRKRASVAPRACGGATPRLATHARSLAASPFPRLRRPEERHHGTRAPWAL
jgi:hypothetical protein